jgi:branched-chain amino acid transport system permease protein
MMVKILDVAVGGLLMGGIFALIAVGFSLQYGVARVLNISHGEFIMLGAFITWWLYTKVGINPLVSLAICGPILFLVGFVLYRTLFKSLRDASPSLAAFEGSALLATFGLSFIAQSTAILIWGAEIKGYSYLSFPVNLGGATFAANRLVALLFAVLIGVIFYLFLARTRLGKGIRAAAQDPAAAGLMGVNISQVLALCFGLGTLMAGVGGSLISIMYPIEATIGMQYTLIAFIVVVLGGLGSIPGSYIGGILLGLIGSVVTYIQPGLSLPAYYILFMLLLLLKPTGILGK